MVRYVPNEKTADEWSGVAMTEGSSRHEIVSDAAVETACMPKCVIVDAPRGHKVQTNKGAV